MNGEQYLEATIWFLAVIIDTGRSLLGSLQTELDNVCAVRY